MISRALLFAAGPTEEATDVSGNGWEPVWGPLLPLIDRPFLQHVVEQLAGLGVREIDVVLSRQPERIEALLGDGSRWGVAIRTHLADQPYSVFRRLLPLSDEAVLIAHSDRLPLGIPTPPITPTLWQTVGGEETGWAVAPLSWLATLPAEANEEAVREALREARGVNFTVDRVLSAQTPADLLAAQKAALSGECPDLLRTGSEIEPGITLSRNVVLHPAARLVPPVFIGEDCRIEAGAQIGPNTVIGPRCVLDVGATVADSLLLSGSYVGEGLEVRDAIVDRNRLISVRHGTSVVVSDSFLLGDLSKTHGRETLRAALSQMAAICLLLLLWPLVLWAKTRVGHGDHFPAVFLPGLPQAARGRIRLVGVPARDADALAALPLDWRALYQHAPVGLVPEAFVVYGPHATPDECYTAEAYFAVTGGIRHDLSLFVRYLARIATSLCSAPSADAAEDFPNQEAKKSESNGVRGSTPVGEVRKT